MGIQVQAKDDGLIKKIKARFCARGDMQLKGIDFFETLRLWCRSYPVDVYFWKYITEKLEACGLKQPKFDPFLFIGPDVMCIVYVDDLILESRHSQDR
jgi:hypothetical protein